MLWGGNRTIQLSKNFNPEILIHTSQLNNGSLSMIGTLIPLKVCIRYQGDAKVHNII
jgi:hypothetical protein